ncbi:MAG: hypothetical protein PVS3B2_06820 [Candidatus Dormibacteraceae bacterium]
MLDRRNECRLQRLDRRTGTLEQSPRDSFLLAHKRKQKVLRFDGLLTCLPRQLGSLLQSLLSLFSEFVQTHVPKLTPAFRLLNR